MKGLKKIIREEFLVVLKENDEAAHSYWDAFDKIKEELVQDFLYDNNENFTKELQWSHVQFPRLKKIWEDYMKLGYVRDVKSLEMIERIMIRNTLLIDVLTNFSGHVDVREGDKYLEEQLIEYVEEQITCFHNQQNPVDTNQYQMDFENPDNNKTASPHAPCDVNPYINIVISEQVEDGKALTDVKDVLFDDLMDKFLSNYFAQGELSDYGLRPLQNLATELYGENDPNEKVVIIDKMLNVVHQRSDLASWFIQGGIDTLSALSGYEVPDEESGGYDTKSAISGRYKMGSYH